jgi:hypothetical protein
MHDWHIDLIALKIFSLLVCICGQMSGAVGIEVGCPVVASESNSSNQEQERQRRIAIFFLLVTVIMRAAQKK